MTTYLPLVYHTQEPRIEPVLPKRILRRHRAGQSTDMVLAVPFVVLVPEVVADGVVETYHVRLYVAAHVVVVGIDAIEAYLHRHALQHTVVHRRPWHIVEVVVLTFRIAHDAVVAELVVCIQEVHQLLGFMPDI